MKGKLVIISAPSGSGKTTIVHHLLEKEPNLSFSISATSRPPRKSEKNGVDYYFISPGEFREKIDAGAFLEWEEVYEDQYYGTLSAEVERLRNSGKHVLFDIDVKGGINLKKQFGEQALSIFVQAPSLEHIEERLRKRATDSGNQLKKRIEKAGEELKYASEFDRVIVNDNLETALQETTLLVKEFTSGKRGDDRKQKKQA